MHRPYWQCCTRRRKIKLIKQNMSIQSYEQSNQQKQSQPQRHQQQQQQSEDASSVVLPIGQLGSTNKRLKLTLSIESFENESSPPIRLICLPENGELCMPFYRGKCSGNNGNCKLIHQEGKFYQLFRLLKEAEQSICACIYRLNSDLMINELIEKRRAGKQVRVISDATLWNPNDNDRKHVINLRRLAGEGVDLRTNFNYVNGGCMHNKYTIIDEKLVLLGSANWTDSAMIRNFETVAIVKLESIVNETRRDFEQIWDQMEDFRFHEKQLLTDAGLPVPSATVTVQSHESTDGSAAMGVPSNAVLTCDANTGPSQVKLMINLNL